MLNFYLPLNKLWALLNINNKSINIVGVLISNPYVD